MTDNPRTLIITGASSGIGLATALRAARRGDHLVLAARSAGPLEDAAAACRVAGAASALPVSTDVGDHDAVEALVVATCGARGRLDGVVHSAGVASYGRVDDEPAEVFEGVLRTNLVGTANVARHAVRRFRRQGHGDLVLIGSVLGHLAVPSMSSYAVSKWGVRALARQLQLENRDMPDLHIDYLAPGGVDTPIYAHAANYVGRRGRPPAPVDDAERVAKVVMRRLDRPRASTQVGRVNDLMRFGFTFTPWAYNRLVGPLFERIAQDRNDAVAPGPGNVLEPTSEPAL